MKITDFYWRRYKIPFKRTFANRYEEMKYREGLLLFLETANGVRGVGEIAPLHGFGGEVADILPHLAALRPHLLNCNVNKCREVVWRYLGAKKYSMAGRLLCAGIEFTLQAVRAYKDDKSLAQSLTETAPRQAVAVNYTVGIRDTEQAVAACVVAVMAGYTCIKVKVGFSTDVGAEVERVAAIRAAVGAAIELRLDANGAWNEATALQMMAAFVPYKIALLEQPIAVGQNDDDIRSFLVLHLQGFPIKLAADESVDDFIRIDYMLWRNAVDVLVLKPMLLGGPERTIELATDAIRQKNSPSLIVTSMLDSGIGIAGALQVAAAIPTNLPACGLATADLLEATLIKESLTPVNGMLAVPQGAGLGVTLDEAQVARYCGPEERGA